MSLGSGNFAHFFVEEGGAVDGTKFCYLWEVEGFVGEALMIVVDFGRLGNGVGTFLGA